MKKMWGGRFKKEIDKGFFNFQKSIQYDYKLAEYDVYHSLIHIGALYAAGIIKKKEYQKLKNALDNILGEVKNGVFKPDLNSEDIHTDIQNKVEKKAGKLSLKLHTLRSRNDQVVFDEKLYCLTQAEKITGRLNGLISGLDSFSSKYKNSFLPGYTHTQRAQAVSFPDYLGCFKEMFKGDIFRMAGFKKNLTAYIGSGALAGSSIPGSAYKKAISYVRKTYSLDKIDIKPAVNSLDNVSNRDFIIDFLSLSAVIQMHLSRMAEDFILYSTKEFGFFNLPEEFCTGSSLMPHKKNPDFLELVRGYTGKIYGNLMSVLTMMKSLPLTYNRDMQLDKEPLFSSSDILIRELEIMAEFARKIKVKGTAVNKALTGLSLYTVDIAGFLTRKGVPFKEAHNIVGKLVKYLEEKKFEISDVPEKVLKSFHKKMDKKSILSLLNPKKSVMSKKGSSRLS